ncbi:4-hydroxy-tetrahydrodipicolinate reductase [Devosia sp. Root105]|uniref:4-hydroxy-tetrahydrodipicolinate reductase n=1 Tax=Devosia sp. Root105 TaxID=1736423 RepID=UPI000700419E|nr:4-hydroxy-tetrahydrodipicolinate reductase [Devosia sp. Root105]KQV09273.1 4-hydroxy-tetrahydrodipicolinate reductase [Devosia sp. Root105]
MSDLKVAIAGAGGKMGAANIRAIAATAGIRVVSAFDRAGAPVIGKDAGELVGLEPLGVSITDDVAAALDAAEAILDFTAPANSVALAQEAAKRGLVHIIGTTGCSEVDDAAIREAAARARIVKAGNFSLGVNLLLGLVKQAAAALPGFDIEILEMHHNRKVDAPSGTALMLGEAAARGRNLDLKTHSVRVRDGHTGPREEGSIGFAALRGGNVIGEHKVILAGPSERIELNHIADNRALFADGAVRAALWVRDQRPGLYSMADVLGFN